MVSWIREDGSLLRENGPALSATERAPRFMAGWR
jgi:hypothetical protein